MAQKIDVTVQEYLVRIYSHPEPPKANTQISDLRYCHA
jgi:hypothetical protein